MTTPTGYLHGYSEKDRERLHRQARFLEPMVHDRLPFRRRKRLLEVGYEKITEGPENVRHLVSELKLPKEALGLLFSQIDETKNGLYRAVAREVRDFLDHSNLAEELARALTALSFEIKTEVRFIPNDSRVRPSPEVRTKVNVRRERVSQPPPEPAADYCDELVNEQKNTRVGTPKERPADARARPPEHPPAPKPAVSAAAKPAAAPAAVPERSASSSGYAVQLAAVRERGDVRIMVAAKIDNPIGRSHRGIPRRLEQVDVSHGGHVIPITYGNIRPGVHLAVAVDATVDGHGRPGIDFQVHRVETRELKNGDGGELEFLP